MKNILCHQRLFGILFCSLAAFTVLFLFPAHRTNAATTEEQETIVQNSLVNAGIDATSVSVSGTTVAIGYRQSVSEFTDIDGMLTKIATILATVSNKLGGNYQVKIRQIFDDGQIMQVIGQSGDGQSYLGGSLSSDAFQEKLELNPITRGPVLVPGTCDPGKGDNCLNNPACGCYPDETCDPGNPAADEKGCVAEVAPANSHLSGSQYVCDAGYEWNEDLTACVPVITCPENAFKFQGECSCNEGYEWNKDKTQCVLSKASTDEDDSDSSGNCFISSMLP